MSKSRARLLVQGCVQGVYFRSYTRSEAERLGLCGWVRNREDGSVELVVEGEKADIETMIAWCRKGPPSANVRNVQVEWQAPKEEFKHFFVAY